MSLRPPSLSARRISPFHHLTHTVTDWHGMTPAYGTMSKTVGTKPAMMDGPRGTPQGRACANTFTLQQLRESGCRRTSFSPSLLGTDGKPSHPGTDLRLCSVRRPIAVPVPSPRFWDDTASQVWLPSCQDLGAPLAHVSRPPTESRARKIGLVDGGGWPSWALGSEGTERRSKVAFPGTSPL